MTRISVEEAARRTLMDVVGEACANRQTIVVTGPQGEVARIVPAASSPAAASRGTWKGHPVHDAEELARMGPEELRSIGWAFPDESAWVDEISGTVDQGAGSQD